MKTSFLILLTGLSLALTALGHAQMSTFPAPPPLEPPSDHVTDQPKPTPASPEAAPEATPGTSAEKKAFEESEPGMTNAAPKTTSPTVSAATLTSMSALDDKVALKEGDTISFRVIEDRDDPVSRVVTDTGEVDFPYIGPVKVADKTCHQVALDVKKRLEVDYYKQATVIIGLDLIIGDDKTQAKDIAWVVGEVRDVGPLELLKVQPMTVSQAIVRAGGFGDFADQRRVKLIHRGPSAPGDEQREPASISNSKDFQLIDVKAIFDGKSVADPVLQDGDYIIVPKRFINT